MGLILDSSVVIAAERSKLPVRELLERVMLVASDQQAALSSVGLVELVHGIYRSRSAEESRVRRQFIHELTGFVKVHAFTAEMGFLAGQVDGEQRSLGITIPYNDLLIGVTALSLGFSLLTSNPRHFSLIPNLNVVLF